MSNRKPKVVDKHVGNYVFEGAPKACFGRKLSTEREACIGQVGRSHPCPHMEDCASCVEARVRVGVTDENDMSLPADYTAPAKYLTTKAALKGVGVVLPEKSGKAVVAAPPTDWHDYLPEQPKQTTISQTELVVAESKLLDNERTYVRTSFNYFREQGRVLADVYSRMSPPEFKTWSARLGRAQQTTSRYIALWCSTKDLGDKGPELLDNPKLTARRMELLLANSQGLDLPVLLAARVEDGNGGTCALLDVPDDRLAEAIAQLKRRLDVEPEVAGMVARAEAKDGAADRERVQREPRESDDDKAARRKEASEARMPTADGGERYVAPFQPLSLLLPLWREAKVWDVSGRPRLAGPLGAHNDKQLKQLRDMRETLARIVEDLDGVLSQLSPK